MKSKESIQIVKNINNAVAKSKLSKNALAQKSGLPISTLNRILSGERNFTVDKMIPIARALNLNLSEIFLGIETKNSDMNTEVAQAKKRLRVGIMSLRKRRITCIKDDSNIIGISELSGDLDLAEPLSSLFESIESSIGTALQNSDMPQYKELSKSEITQPTFLNNIDIKLVTQSYEFMDKRKNFLYKANQIFSSALHLPDWQITYLSDFHDSDGISLVVDKGVSLSIKREGRLEKIGGWKFPTYDLGGENWLGNEAVKHTIEVYEGLDKASKLSSDILAMFNGKIEKIVETCFQGVRDTDIFCRFAEILIRCFYQGDKKAITIISQGINKVNLLIAAADKKLKTKPKISINGSLSDIYLKYIDHDRIAEATDNKAKVSLLTEITKPYLKDNGVNYIE